MLMYIDSAYKLTRYTNFEVQESYPASGHGDSVTRYDVVGQRHDGGKEVVVELPARTAAEVFVDMARVYITK